MPQRDRRPVEIQQDIAAELERLTAIFDELGNDVDELVRQLLHQAADAGKKALLIGPALGAFTAGLLLMRRRRKRRRGEPGADA